MILDCGLPGPNYLGRGAAAAGFSPTRLRLRLTAGTRAVGPDSLNGLRLPVNEW